MPQQQTSSPGQGQQFDWWAAPAAARQSGAGQSGAYQSGAYPNAGQSGAYPGAGPSGADWSGRSNPVPAPAPAAPAAQPSPAAPGAPRARATTAGLPSTAGAMPARPGQHPVPPLPGRSGPSPAEARPAVDSSTEVYRTVQASGAFQEIRHSYRAFVFPVSGAFLGWYLMYVAAQAAAPGVMRSQIAGPVNVAWLLGLLQFATTFVLTWLYARNARTKRDRAALGLRWDTQDQLR